MSRDLVGWSSATRHPEHHEVESCSTLYESRPAAPPARLLGARRESCSTLYESRPRCVSCVVRCTGSISSRELLDALGVETNSKYRTLIMLRRCCESCSTLYESRLAVRSPISTASLRVETRLPDLSSVDFGRRESCSALYESRREGQRAVCGRSVSRDVARAARRSTSRDIPVRPDWSRVDLVPCRESCSTLYESRRVIATRVNPNGGRESCSTLYASRPRDISSRSIAASWRAAVARAARRSMSRDNSA